MKKPLLLMLALLACFMCVTAQSAFVGGLIQEVAAGKWKDIRHLKCV